MLPFLKCPYRQIYGQNLGRVGNRQWLLMRPELLKWEKKIVWNEVAMIVYILKTIEHVKGMNFMV